MKGDKTYCRIKSYMRETKTFIIRANGDIEDSLLPFTQDQLSNKAKLFDAMKSGTPLLLLCYDTIGGRDIYTTNLDKLTTKHIDKTLTIAMNVPSLSISFTTNNAAYNATLLNTVYEALGESIDRDEKYELAKQLLAANRVLKIRKTLFKDSYLLSRPFISA